VTQSPAPRAVGTWPAFESSFRYRSVVISGRSERPEGHEREQGIDVLIEKLIPGHPAEVRPSSWKELSKTMHPSRVRISDLPRDVVQVLLAHRPAQ
jgi:nitroimidazol reductase NimA-like FMN-containing flavoprotein (pyridoxamine 5'-phosphate oxidase superfamily)